MDYQHRFLKTRLFLEHLVESSAKGVWTMMVASEEESFLHKDFPIITSATKVAGIAMTFTKI